MRANLWLLPLVAALTPPIPPPRPVARQSCPVAPNAAQNGASVAKAQSLQTQALQAKCPFWKRRSLDALASATFAARWLAARHKSLALPALLPALFDDGDAEAANARKLPAGTPASAVLATLRADFERRQYYVTGRLTRALYAEDCFFDSPDPDMPVRDYRTFASALGGLFDHSASRVDLLAIDLVSGGGDGASSRGAVLVADWRLEATLRLPWRPRIKPYVGRTVYECHADTGLIGRHVETWSVTALDSFASALVPALGALGAPRAPPAAELRARRAGGPELELAERWPGTAAAEPAPCPWSATKRAALGLALWALQGSSAAEAMPGAPPPPPPAPDSVRREQVRSQYEVEMAAARRALGPSAAGFEEAPVGVPSVGVPEAAASGRESADGE